MPSVYGLLQVWLFDRAGERVEHQLDATDRALARSVFLVTTVSCTGERSTGSAFLTQVDGEPVLLTNRHVVDGARTVGLRTIEGDSGPRVASWQVSRTQDVAVLTLADPSQRPPALPLADDRPAEGAEVRTVGFPSAMPFTTTGTVASVQAGRMTLRIETGPGASGSPVLDEASGTVVGQLYGRTRDDLGAATPAPGVRAALDELGEPRSGCAG